MKYRKFLGIVLIGVIAGLSLFLFDHLLKDEHIEKIDAQISLASIPAFPGAEGYGGYTYGGRYNPFTGQNGTVLKVTSLADSGPGTLREAVTTPGPRIIVFEVSGIIELMTPLIISEPFCTIAGQTAPGHGICLKNEDLVIMAPNVVIRYIHSRPGDEINRDPENIDAIQVIGNPPSDTYNVILDHCSLSWSQDETFSTWYESHDITIQWCLISEGLNNAHHPQGAHSKGVLVGDGSDNITIHHNLISHHIDRNPFIKSGAVDYFNNIHYDFERPMHLWPPDYGEKIPIRINVIGNLWIRGPSSYNYVQPSIQIYNEFPTDELPQIYIKDNWGPTISNPEGFASDYEILGMYYEDFPDSTELRRITDTYCLTSAIMGRPNVTINEAFDAYTLVLERAGVSLVRDSVDMRIISEVQNRTGKVIDSVEDVGGWPQYSSEITPVDSDQDGIPDFWELIHGLDSFNSLDNWSDRDGNGYVAIEDYINSIVL